jgi:hypothetical protein
MKRSVVIHAHFYQPPRDNPWLDEIEAEPGAAPFHDWNQRIDRECYRAVVAARVMGAHGRIAHVLNTLEWMSFNVGPTLFEWMERHAPDTYAQMLSADRASLKRLGHGNAIAQPYHHVILPLASRRDKRTEVRWGKADFVRRFGREPEGMWLPETALDDETLDVLAEQGIRFTVVAPTQLKSCPPNGAAGRYVTSNGREIALFPYHGDISHGIAFGGLVRDAEDWLHAIWNVPHTPAADATRSRKGAKAGSAGALLVSAATDGETYGHHHKFAEMALAAVIERSRGRGATVENYASFLARHPAEVDVHIVEPSAWSCAHGVERWRSDCSCRIDGHHNPSQAWRTPLREGLTRLADALHTTYEREAAALFDDPWEARDAWGAAVSAGTPDARGHFLDRWLVSGSGDDERRSRALELLEMERDALRMFTSCAWFFDDIGGIEPRQVLRYAARALQAAPEPDSLEATLRAVLGAARSNHAHVGTGADVFGSILPSRPASARIAAAARALLDLGQDPNPLVQPAFRVEVHGDTLLVVHLATLRRSEWRVSLALRTSHDVVYRVRSARDGAEYAIALVELPERPRLVVRRELRRALLSRCLTVAELEQLASGEAGLRDVAGLALTRALGRLAGAGAAHAEVLDTAHVTLDLFEQLESTIPFDAQTVFWRVWATASPETRVSLSKLATRLGFEG